MFTASCAWACLPPGANILHDFRRGVTPNFLNQRRLAFFEFYDALFHEHHFGLVPRERGLEHRAVKLCRHIIENGLDWHARDCIVTF